MSFLAGPGVGGQVAFAQPELLWLLGLPAFLLLLWALRFTRRMIDVRRLKRRRSLPVRERFAVAGDLGSWLLIILALASLAVALARPRGVTSVINRAGIDIVVLQDGSASMQVADVSSASAPGFPEELRRRC